VKGSGSCRRNTGRGEGGAMREGGVEGGGGRGREWGRVYCIEMEDVVGVRTRAMGAAEGEERCRR
jgi:hypothetical protein